MKEWIHSPPSFLFSHRPLDTLWKWTLINNVSLRHAQLSLKCLKTPTPSNQNNTHNDRFNLFLVPTLKYYSLATYYVWRYCLKLLLLALVEGISLPYFTSVLLPKTCIYKEWSNPLSKIFLCKNKNNLISQSPKLILKTVDQSLEVQKKEQYEQ